MKRSLKTKVRALGVLQVTLIAAIMMLLGVLFFNKMLNDEARFVDGTHEVKLREAEGLAKMLALELGRLDALRHARSGANVDKVNEVCAVLWEKVTFIPALDHLDLIAAGRQPNTYLCLRPKGQPQACENIEGFDDLAARFAQVDRLQKIGDGTYVLPLYVGGASWGLLRMGISNTTVQHTLQKIGYQNRQDKAAFVVVFVLCLGAAAIVLTLVLAAFFRRIHRPLIALTHNAVVFGEHPDSELEPVDADPEDEVGVLAHRFDEMRLRLAETIASLTQAVEQKDKAMHEMEQKDQLLRRSERLASVGVLAAGVAHEIGNKLNPMGFVAHNMKKRIEKGKPLDVEQLDVLTRAVESCTEIIDKLRSLARHEDKPTEAVDLNAVITDVTMLLSAQSKSRGVDLVCDLAESIPSIAGVHGDLVQVLINLVVNARDAVIDADRSDGRVILRTSVNRTQVVLEVEDNGIGMTQDVRDRVFEPFFTTKGLATGGGTGGTGLGLYICHGILRAHGVEPQITTAAGKGTSFVMAFDASS